MLLLQGDVFFYYGLRNFHQNLRRYMDSRDDTQLAGRMKNLKVAPTKSVAVPVHHSVLYSFIPN